MGGTRKKSIYEDIIAAGLSSTLAIAADNIYMKLGKPAKRKGKRNHLLFFCCYHANLENGRHYSAETLAQRLGVPNKEMAKCFNMFSEVETGYSPSHEAVIGMRADQQARTYLEEMGMDRETIDWMTQRIESILQRSVVLTQDCPKKVSLACILYLFRVCGYDIKIKDYADHVNMCEATIQTVYKEIEAVDNTIAEAI